MKKIKEIFFHSPKRYIIALCLAIILVIINLWINGFNSFINYVNGFSISGMVVILIGGLATVSYYGAFDTISYGFSTIKQKRKYNNLYDYSLKKKEERKNKVFPFTPYYTVGLFFLIISLIMLLF